MSTSFLKAIGLSDGEIKVYVALLRIGRSSLNPIQEGTGIDRRNIYDILNKLIDKGLVSYTVENRKKTFHVTHPTRIGEYLEEEGRVLDEKKRLIAEHLPEVLQLYNEKKSAVQAEVFRGNEGLKTLLNEALEWPEHFWIGGNGAIEKTGLKFWFKHWMQRRVKLRRMLYDLADADTYLDGLEPDKIAIHKKNYYKRCELPPHLSSPMVILIFGNKVAQITWEEQPFAFVLESQQIRQSFMQYFHFFWKDPW